LTRLSVSRYFPIAEGNVLELGLSDCWVFRCTNFASFGCPVSSPYLHTISPGTESSVWEPAFCFAVCTCVGILACASCQVSFCKSGAMELCLATTRHFLSAHFIFFDGFFARRGTPLLCCDRCVGLSNGRAVDRHSDFLREICSVRQSWETSIGPCRGLWLGSIPLR
jgi:hypothetical protein